MLRLQLFALLAVFTLLDGAALHHPPCMYHRGPHSEFCKLVIAAYKLNKETLHHMSGRTMFDDSKNEVTSANRAIDDVLSKKQARKLLQPLRKALEYDGGAVVLVLWECNGNVTKQPCSTIFRGVFKATTDLVEATIIVADGEKKNKVQTLYNAFKKYNNQTESISGFIVEVLNALQ